MATYAPAHTLGGDAGEDYLQGVDVAAQESLVDLPEDLLVPVLRVAGELRLARRDGLEERGDGPRIVAST